jgi:hypothetical protein
MPTNLPPEYFDADKRYRSAKTPAEKLAIHLQTVKKSIQSVIYFSTHVVVQLAFKLHITIRYY